MTGTEHQHDEFVVVDFVDNPVVAGAVAQLAQPALELHAPFRSRIKRKLPNRGENTARDRRVEPADDSRRRRHVRDGVLRHRTLETQLPKELSVGHAPFLCTGKRGVSDIRLILKRFQRAVEELR